MPFEELDILKIKKNNAFCVGDLHGEFNKLDTLISTVSDCVVFFCGDIGMGFYDRTFYNKEFKKYNKKCKERGIEFVMIRGNHDDPSYFEDNPIKLKYIHFVRDYTVVQVETDIRTFNFLCIGGAISIDRYWRKMKNIGYWTDEPAYYNDKALNELIDAHINVDFVCTHTAPSFCEPTTKDGVSSWMMLDHALEADLDAERNVFDQVLHHLNLDAHNIIGWYYGHFHYHYSSYIEGIHYTMCDCVRSNGVFPFDLVDCRLDSIV